MKIGYLLLALAGLAIGFALPTFAQDQNTISPEVRQKIEAVFERFQEAYNKHGAAAMADLYTRDAVEFRSWQGLASGQEVIGKRFAFDFASGPGKMVNELVHAYAVGDDICAISKTTVGPSKGQAVTLYVDDADAWKIRMAYVNHSAQDKKANDPQVRQQIEAEFVKFQEAHNKHDAAAMAALYTQDAVEVQSWATSWGGGTFSGRQAIEKMFGVDFALNRGQMANELVQLYAIGNDICAIADRSVGEWKGHAVTIHVREADTWKIRVAYVK